MNWFKAKPKPQPKDEFMQPAPTEYSFTRGGTIYRVGTRTLYEASDGSVWEDLGTNWVQIAESRIAWLPLSAYTGEEYDPDWL